MKYSSTFKDKIGCKNEKEVFSYLITNLNDSIKSWDYFVNWKKVIDNTKDIEIDLNILTELSNGNLKYEDFSFEGKKDLTDKEISKAVRFAFNSGLLKIFKDKT